MLQSQGFGSRKECTKLVRSGRLMIDQRVVDLPSEIVQLQNLHFEVDGTPWSYFDTLYLAYNKPLGMECSRSPEHNESIFSDFPFPFLARDLQPAGRLDVDTDGLLLLSDNGRFIHHITSPKQRISRRYRISTRHPVSRSDLQKLSDGVELRGEEGLFRAFDLEQLGDRELRFSIDRGRYHQVRRMIAAISNRLERLTREAIGTLTFEGIEPGHWRHLTTEELHSLGWSE